MRLREGRHGNERHANTELIEAGTIDRKRIGRICRSTKLCCKHLADRAIHPAQKQFVCRALPGAYSVRRALSALLRGRRCYVIVVAAMLVVGEEQNRVLPVGTFAQRVDDLGDEQLAFANVGWRMLVVFGHRADAESRFDERHRRQLSRGGIGKELRSLTSVRKIRLCGKSEK